MFCISMIVSDFNPIFFTRMFLMKNGHRAVWTMVGAALISLMPVTQARANFVGIHISGNLYHINEATGMGSEVANTQNIGFNALAQDSNDRLISSDTAPNATHLFEIDPFDGSNTIVASTSPAHSVRGLAFSPTDELFAVVNGQDITNQDLPDELYRVNTINR